MLDSLLDHRDLALTQLSGTSAEAINAAIVAVALSNGSRQHAREALESFWRGIADPTAAELLHGLLGPVGRYWRDSLGDWLLAGAAFNVGGAQALGVHPLRDAVAAHVDIDAIRSDSSPALFVTVTSVRTGLPRVISNDTMSVDPLLASACLLHLFPSVEIDGEPYWDGALHQSSAKLSDPMVIDESSHFDRRDAQRIRMRRVDQHVVLLDEDD